MIHASALLLGVASLRLEPAPITPLATVGASTSTTIATTPTTNKPHAKPYTHVAHTRGDLLEERWDKLRSKPLRRSLALWRFFSVAAIRLVRANITDDAARTNATAAWLCDGLLNLGPTMIKLGQVFSARSDLLHPAYISRLEALQTAVPSVSAPRVRAAVERELGAPLESRFETFCLEPLAGASLGQVHRARLGGKEVAVKVQRAQLRALFDTDFYNIRLFARLMNAFETVRRFLRRRRRRSGPAATAARDWMEYADDAARLLYSEIDYVNEGRNAEAFASALPPESRVVVPRVIWEATTPRLLTMEYVESVKMTDGDALDALGLDKPRLRQQVVDTFLMQLLTTGILHCDPHPGNMCVAPGGEIVLYDYGMMETLPVEVTRGLRDAALALFGGSPGPSDAEIDVAAARLVGAVRECGFVSADADAAKLQRVGRYAVRAFKDRAAGRTVADITESVGPELQALLDDGAIAFPSCFTVIGRAFASVDGIARSLDPANYDFAKACEPAVGKLIEAEYKRVGDELTKRVVDELRAGLVDGSTERRAADAILITTALVVGYAMGSSL